MRKKWLLVLVVLILLTGCGVRELREGETTIARVPITLVWGGISSSFPMDLPSEEKSVSLTFQLKGGDVCAVNPNEELKKAFELPKIWDLEIHNGLCLPLTDEEIRKFKTDGMKVEVDVDNCYMQNGEWMRCTYNGSDVVVSLKHGMIEVGPVPNEDLKRLGLEIFVFKVNHSR